MSDIAIEAGVSVGTVSKVLNGSDRVSQETRDRVQDLLSARNYERRSAARAGPVPIVDLVLREVSNPWATEIIAGAVEAARKAHATVAVNVLPDVGGHGSWLDDIFARGTKGVIVLLARLSEREKAALRSRGIPVAVIDPRGEPEPGVPTVGATNWSGAFMATRHLAELGHQRIAIITGPRDLFCSRVRMDGYRSAMEAAGLPVDPDLVRWGDFHVEAAFKHATTMLSMEERPTAIFAGSDLQAMGVLEAARLARMPVPAQLSLVGFDDIPLSRWMSPPLTSVRQPLAEMAATAVRLVLSHSERPRQEDGSVELATTLVVRESTGAPPRTARRA
ncbi:MAG TPA: LacI family DNA-binding transcriptional regulator [Acidimicrobiales bacterium]|nr:LacI family DNA-binding transcriptional regulator [Acidimicrobiales bacterium]